MAMHHEIPCYVNWIAEKQKTHTHDVDWSEGENTYTCIDRDMQTETELSRVGERKTDMNTELGLSFQTWGCGLASAKPHWTSEFHGQSYTEATRRLAWHRLDPDRHVCVRDEVRYSESERDRERERQNLQYAREYSTHTKKKVRTGIENITFFRGKKIPTLKNLLCAGLPLIKISPLRLEEGLRPASESKRVVLPPPYPHTAHTVDLFSMSLEKHTGR